MKTLTISEFCSQLTYLSDVPAARIEAMVVTRRGKPVLAVLPWEQYDAIRESLEIMADDSLLTALRASIQQARQKPLSWVKAKADLEL